MIYYSHYQSAKDEIQRLEIQFQNNSHSEEILKFNLEVVLKKIDLEILQEQYPIALEYTLDAIEMAKSKNFADIELKAELHKALIYEITQKKDESLKSLEQAYKIYPENKLDSLYSSYCIRYSSFHNIFGKKEIAHT